MIESYHCQRCDVWGDALVDGRRCWCCQRTDAIDWGRIAPTGPNPHNYRWEGSEE